ncbi:MAG: SOS response-associated peptidase, partial [Bacteroidota bacterium]
VVTNTAPDKIQYFRWGLIPFWANDEKIASRLINARVETITEKPAFRQAIEQRRCLVPFDGFYEWKKIGNQKIPHRICRKDEGIFSIAGIWETWTSPQGTSLFTFTLLTRAPNNLLAPIHNRMPAILQKEQEQMWIDPNCSTQEALALLSPFPDELLKAYPVSKRINKVQENDPRLLEERPNDTPIQGTLF